MGQLEEEVVLSHSGDQVPLLVWNSKQYQSLIPCVTVCIVCMKCPHMVIEIFEAEIFREDSLDDVQLYE